MAETTINYFAQTDFRGKRIRFGVKAEDRAKHVYVIGKTGMGKSTLLENLVIQDIKNGEGLAFVDPHGKSAEFLLDFVPPERLKDVIYFAPFDLEYPISFNIMEDVGHDKRHLVANGLMSSFKKIWPDVWSSRMEYILNNCLLALLEYPEATLLGVNRLLSDKVYRQKVVDNVTDPSVKSFWVDEFAKYNERYMQEAGDAIKNKIGQFTANPLIRNIIGQPKSTIDLRQVMDEKKILIVNLSKGRLGEQNANLLGGILITKIYLAAMSRASAESNLLSRLPYFYLFVDEFQSFVNESFADILSEARKYKLSLTIAHQYIEQMPEEVRNAVFGNVGTTIAFRVGPFDAEVLETIFFPTFTKEDLVNLGFAQIYLTLSIDGVGSPPFSATTLPPIVVTTSSLKEEIIDNVRKTYAKPREVVEKEITDWYVPDVASAKTSPSTSAKARTPERVGASAPSRAKPVEVVPKKVTLPPAKSTPKEVVKEVPKTFSLGVLKNKPKPDKNKNELKDLLSGIMSEKKVEKKQETPKVDVVAKQESAGISVERLRKMLEVNLDE
ncbi:MAG TPA: type IV secretion system DNA-binding domain-containing protein [Candidatus Paceibacterota bacterium]|nr:type IV secretion system DNA-binding domain-containing protein [Candidatus Paceibacterota bacterium]